jgi:hypothetical protein
MDADIILYAPFKEHVDIVELHGSAVEDAVPFIFRDHAAVEGNDIFILPVIKIQLLQCLLGTVIGPSRGQNKFDAQRSESFDGPAVFFCYAAVRQNEGLVQIAGNDLIHGGSPFLILDFSIAYFE